MAKIAIFTRSLGGGGTQRVLVTLARGFVDRGHQVDFVLVRARGEFLEQLPDAVRVVDLNVRSALAGVPTFIRHPRHTWRLAPALLRARKPSSNYGSVGGLIDYLTREEPDVMMSARAHCNIAASWARDASGVKTRLVLRDGNVLNARPENPKELETLRRFYRRADRIIACSDGVREELAAALELSDPSVLTTIHNPVRDEARRGEFGKPEHPWFQEDVPILLAVGRLHPQKDFATLLRAFAQLRAQRPCRLLVLGRGELKDDLEALARELRVEADVAFPGFAPDVFSYMSHASVFVMSSAWEGFGVVLIEALACGCPVVSTDCRSGPAEILRDGAIGPLVPVGDATALAAAIAGVLDDPPDPATLRTRAEDFSASAVTDRYLQVLLGE